MRFIYFGALLFTLPHLSHGADGDIQGFASGSLLLINNFVIPFLISLAVLFFIYNVTRYFILQSSDVEGRVKARALALWGILAFVFIVAFWGIIAFVVLGFGFEMRGPLTPDFLTTQGADFAGTPLGGNDAADGVLLPGMGGDADVDPSPITGNNNNPPEDNDAADGALLPGMGGDADVEDPPVTGPEDNDAVGDTPLAPGDGGDADADASPEPLLRVQQNRDEIAATGEAFATDDLPDIVGTNSDFVAAALLDPLRNPGEANDLDQLQAAYRLRELGEIDNDQLQEYFDNTNTVRTNSGLDPITVIDVSSNLDLPVTPEFLAAQDATADNIRAAVQEYNQNPTRDNITEEEILTPLTDRQLSLDQRYENFNQLYDDNSKRALMTDEFAEEYLNYLNTEAILRGENLDDLYN